MRAPLLLLLLLLLLLHDVSSDNVGNTTTASPEDKQDTTSTTTTSSPTSSPTSKPSTQPPNTAALLSTSSEAASTSKMGSPTSSATTISPTTSPKSTTTSHLTSSPSNQQPAAPTPAKSTTEKQGGSSPTPTASPSTLQLSALTNSTTTPVASTSTTQQNTATAATSGAKPAENPVPTQTTSPPTTSTSSVATVTTSPCTVGNGSCTSAQLTSTVGSTTDPTANLPPSTKDHSVSSPPSVTNQSHSSPASPVHGPASCPQPGSTDSSSTPSAAPVSSAPGKTSPSSPTGTTGKGQAVATTTTPRADHTSQGLVPDKTGATEQSPASAQPSAPAQGDQTISSRPDQRHPNISFKNEIVCKDQIQDTWPIINLKEAKTCTDWRAASSESFFELFCSVGRQAFDVHRDKCTVTLASSTPQRWAVHAVVHRLLHPEDVFEELKEKRNELEKLGIVNVTYLNQEMEEEVKDQFSTPLIITIITLACSLLLVAAIYGCCHQRFSQKKNQHIHPDLPGFDDGRAILIFNQRLTEELQTMENGYHDNPTLEVMETCSEMQEKKVNLNGELGDSWIVPLDTIMKEDLEEEEDTHL
uniref:Podocalyxin n=1 Tax=Cairina moschata TaxID=8855 RepID=A0A8C3BFS9_CAIMO